MTRRGRQHVLGRLVRMCAGGRAPRQEEPAARGEPARKRSMRLGDLLGGAGDAEEETGAGAVPGVPSSEPELSLERLDDYVAQVRNKKSMEEQTLGARSIRRLLSTESPPIEAVTATEVHRDLVALLGDKTRESQARFEAAWALTNIASGSSVQTRLVVEADVLSALTVCFTDDEGTTKDVQDQCVWMLGNISGDRVEMRDLVLDYRGFDVVATLSALVLGFVEDPPTSTLTMARNTTWAMSNLCRGKPSPRFEKVRALVLPLARLVKETSDVEVLADACWALSYLSDGSNEQISVVQDSGVTEHLIKLLDHESASVQVPALRTVGNFVTGSDPQTQQVVDGGALGRFKHLIETSTRSGIVKEACWATSNITAGNVAQIQAVFDAGLMETIVAKFPDAANDTRKEMIWVLANATSGGTHEQILWMCTSRIAGPLVEAMRVDDPRVPMLGLEAIQAMLRACKSSSEGRLETFKQLLNDDHNIEAALALHAGGRAVMARTTSIAQSILTIYFGVDPSEQDWEALVDEPDGFVSWNVWRDANDFESLSDAVLFWENLAVDDDDKGDTPNTEPTLVIDPYVSSDNVRGVIHFLSKLRSAEEFKMGNEVKHGLAVRVMEALETLCQDDYARDEIIARMIESLDACGDKPIWALNQLHLMGLIAHARGDRDALRALGRRVLNLNVVHENANRIIRETYNGEVDDVCIFLGLELALREDLNLPVSAKAMIFRNYAPIPLEEIQKTKAQAEAINEDEFELWLLDWPEWQRQLRHEAAAELSWEELPRNSRRFSDSFLNLFGEAMADPVRIGKSGPIWSLEDLLKHWVATGLDINNTPRTIQDIQGLSRAHKRLSLPRLSRSSFSSKASQS